MDFWIRPLGKKRRNRAMNNGGRGEKQEIKVPSGSQTSVSIQKTMTVIITI